MNKQPLAIFDIDGTLFRSSLAVELIYELVNQKIFSRQAQKEIQTDYIAWVNRQDSYEKFIKQVINVYLRYLGNCKKKDIKRVSKKVVLTHHQRVYCYTRQLIKNLKKKKYFLFALSGSPIEIVKAFNKFWPFDYSIGTIFETDKKGQYYTGKVKLEPAKQKKELIDQLIKKHGFSLKNSLGIGDTESDAGFLNMVEKAIAFNPNANLKKIAEKKKWKIIVERKDVIYEIE